VATAGRGASLSALRRREEYTGWLFVTPVVAGILIFQLYPVIFALYTSLTEWDLVTAPRWVGAGNFLALLTTDRYFGTAISNTAIYTLGTVVPGVALALLFAGLLNAGIRGRFVYRSIFFVPVIAPLVSIAILWQWIYEPNFGILNFILRLFGIPGPVWLGTSQWALLAVIILAIWRRLGYDIVLFLAGLQSISREYYEASALDGANARQQFTHVTFPLLSPVTFLVLVLGIIDALQVFTVPFVMTGGGPANSTLTVVLLLYQNAFERERMGLASAIAYCLFAVVMLMTLINFGLQRLWVFYEDSR
jgi:multiple sugar transport system permease protein